MNRPSRKPQTASLKPAFTLVELSKTMSKRAFTLVELLVVVSIIIILIAILMPAMEQAIYQAQLAVCAARLDAIGTTGTVYASDNQGRYMERKPAGLMKPTTIKDAGYGSDIRQALKPYMAINKLLNDPLAPGPIDYEAGPPSPRVDVNYHLFWSWGYGGVEETMTGMHNAFSYKESRFNVVASDSMILVNGTTGVETSHSFRGVGKAAVYNGSIARWEGAAGASPDDDGMEMNVAYRDGSVRRFNEVLPFNGDNDVRNDGSFRQLPVFADPNAYYPNISTFLPRSQ